MAPKKQPIIGNRPLLKENPLPLLGAPTPLQPQPQPCRERACLRILPGAIGDAHPPSTYEGQHLQMIDDMKEEMAKQQALFNYKLALDRENAAHE